ncbi:hypothetical protein [Terriglobus tenax]|uniref:hypothetical protein n=1 Tax=Terriglobus tenax TaxID=1111115 RepID=UPI0021E05D34|nr:hypothetical protein [Terriglobus tenax]
MKRLSAVFAVLLAAGPLAAETCTTQSQMQAIDRDGIAQAARTLALAMQANDPAAIKAQSSADLASNFAAVASLTGDTSPKLKGSPLAVESVWLLDATGLKPNTDGSPATGQFFCTLNQSSTETDFIIDGLPAGKYAFAIVNAGGANPWRISMLLRNEGGWKLAGIYPKATTSAGKDGLYYWTTARTMARQNQPWNAWLYYQQAAELLQPVGFVGSTHLEKLRTEASAAAPPVVQKGLSAEQPLVLRATDGSEYRITGFGFNDSVSKDKVDLVVHLKVETMGDSVAARKRNTEAARTLVLAYPELRSAFHGVWVSSEAAGASAFATEEPMENLR